VVDHDGQQDSDLGAIGRDPDVFETFYRTHVEAVSRFVARRVGDPHAVADLTAEVFLAVIESAHTYRPDRGSPTGWLYGVARNVVAADRRGRHRHLDAMRRMAGRRPLDSEDIVRLEERIDAEGAARRTYQALAQLPDSTRALLELVAVDGLTVAEAAAVLGISAMVARARLYRARKMLRAVLTDPHPALT
jgi:RNA polymerase sigma factor (sigma-70 family)